LPARRSRCTASGIRHPNRSTSTVKQAEQAIVPPRLYGRVLSVAQVLAWSAIPLGSLAGAAAINLSGSVTGVYAVIGGLIAAIALAFAFSPVAHGDRYLAEAAERWAAPAGR
jgi:hypothetical protein